MSQGVLTIDNANKPTPSIQKFQEPRNKRNQTENKSQNKLYIHYTHEKRFQTMKPDLHEVHKEILNQSATKNVKMIVGNRNRRNATHELIRKRPEQILLTNKSIPSESPIKKRHMNKYINLSILSFNRQTIAKEQNNKRPDLNKLTNLGLIMYCHFYLK